MGFAQSMGPDLRTLLPLHLHTEEGPCRPRGPRPPACSSSTSTAPTSAPGGTSMRSATRPSPAAQRSRGLPGVVVSGTESCGEGRQARHPWGFPGDSQTVPDRSRPSGPFNGGPPWHVGRPWGTVIPPSSAPSLPPNPLPPVLNPRPPPTV